MNRPLVSRGSNSRSTFLWTDAIPFACGAVTLLATSWALLPHFAYPPQHLWAGLVPIGAISLGACAASGFAVGSVIAGRRPSPLALALMQIASPLLYVATFVIGSGQQAHLAVHVVSLDPSGVTHAALTGPLAYSLVVLSGLGFAIGAFAVIVLQNTPVHCLHCRKYLPRRASSHVAWPTCDLDAATAARTLRQPHVALLVQRAHVSRGTA